MESVTEHQPLRRAALDIAEDILAAASYSRDGGIFWCQPQAPRDETGRPRQLDSNLYPGATGIALFFALAGRILGVERYRSLAAEVVAPLRRDLAEILAAPDRAAAVRRPIGGLAGLGSLVYGLVRLGDALDQPDLWNEAADLALLITRERIAADERLEVMYGAAGAIFALLALAERRAGPNRAGHTPLDLALLAADRILHHRPTWSRRTAAAAPAGPTPPLGFCHGSAGILCALGRLAARSRRTDLARVAAEEWDAIEDAYDPASRGWWLDEPGGVPAGLSWCNGASGIALAGAEIGAATRRTTTTAVDGAIASLCEADLGGKDHLCCGNMSRVDALVRLAVLRQDPHLRDVATDLAERVIARAQMEGRFRLMLHPEPLADVRLFPGLAGIGYTLLRVSSPTDVPCLSSLS